MNAIAKGKNRRNAPRISANYRVQLQSIDDQPASGSPNLQTYVTRDLSDRGISLWANQPLAVQSVHLLTFEHGDRFVQEVTSRSGAVVWVSKVPERERHLIGIRFLDD